jgi:hypothetical protein
VEARSRRPKFKEYQRVHYAEAFARTLGVREVSYGGRIDIANVCNHGLLLVSGHGVPMPSAVFVKERFTRDEMEDPDEMAYYFAGFSNRPGEIYINGDHPAWLDLVAVMRRARANHDLSTGDPRHPIVHELGELAVHLSVGPERFDPLHESYLQDEAEFRRMGESGVLDDLADVVSDRAILNHSEFVAEVFAALMLGRTELLDNDAVIGAYTRFGGAPIRQYDSHL